MKTQEFLQLLEAHSGKALLFEYAPGHYVGANYHITEIKNLTIDSVDCGAKADSWNETIVQLWESPDEKDKTEYMSAFKALGILKKVDSIRAMDRDAEVKFEYSNSRFHTAQLFVDDVLWDNNKFLLKLAVEKTDCKAKEACGVPVTVQVGNENSCAPGSGCC